MKYIAIFLFGLLFAPPKAYREINLYDSSGGASVFIDHYLTDQVVYLWNGKPVAYLHQNFNATDVYGFNGKHLGWFENGFLRDNEGNIIAATPEASGKIISGEPMKGLKDTPPDKKFRDQEPPKPYFGALWSSTSAAEYLLKGIDK